MLAEYDPVNEQYLNKYIYAGSQRIATRDDREGEDRLYFYLNDHLRLVIDSVGNRRDTHQYYCFGGNAGETVGTGQAYKYTGKPLDVEHGLDLYYYGARYYDAELGRFTQIDRFRKKYPALAPYQYGANCPIVIIDINGDSLSVEVFTGTAQDKAVVETAIKTIENAGPIGSMIIGIVKSNDFPNVIRVGAHPQSPNAPVAVPVDAKKASTPGQGSEADVFTDPNVVVSEQTPSGGTRTVPLEVQLVHEIIHVLIDNMGKRTTTTQTETETQNVEELVRPELGHPSRNK